MATEPIQEQHEDQQYQPHLQEIQQEDLRLQRQEEAQAQSINNLVAVIIQVVLIEIHRQEVLATHAVAAQDLDQVALCQDHQEEVEVLEEEDHQAVEEEDANPYY